MAGNEQSHRKLAKIQTALVTSGLAYTKAGGIKVMPIDGVSPSTQTVQRQNLPLRSATFYYTNGEPSGLAKEFLDFTIGSTGQKIVAQVALFRSSSDSVRLMTKSRRSQRPAGFCFQ